MRTGCRRAKQSGAGASLDWQVPTRMTGWERKVFAKSKIVYFSSIPRNSAARLQVPPAFSQGRNNSRLSS